MVSATARSLARLSREKLIELCISWSLSSKTTPYLAANRDAVEAEEEDYLHEPARSRKDLNSVFKAIGNAEADFESLSKKDIIDRIIDGDWRRGLSHHQLASIDFANLEENDESLRWTALKLVPFTVDSIEPGERPSKRRKTDCAQSNTQLPHYPDATPSLFIENLKTHVAPLVKANYQAHRIASLKLNIVRLYISPNTAFAPLSANIPRQGRRLVEANRIMYIALPDSCPYVYVSISGATKPEKRGDKLVIPKVDIAATKRIVLEAIPKALSRPQQRWSIENTQLITKSLKSVSLLRGGGRAGITGGSFANLRARSNVSEEIERKDDRNNFPTDCEDEQAKREKLIEQRFGPMEGNDHAKLDRVQIKVYSLTTSKKVNQKRKIMCDDDDVSTPISITLHGGDVFAGLKQFALLYPECVDVEKMPVALTGETRSTTLSI